MCWRGFRGCLSFLSIIPIKGEYPDAIKHSYLFPAVGFMLGWLGIGVGLLLSQLAPIIFGIVSWGMLSLLNAAQHLDGLLDLGDGLMFRGAPDQRYLIMQDPRHGTGGFALGMSVVLLTISGLNMLQPWLDPWRMLLKLSWLEGYSSSCMLIPLMLGQAHPQSSAAAFKQSLARSSSSFWISWCCWLGLGFWVMDLSWSLMLKLIFAAGSLSYMISKLALKLLGGITGDCLGALHELSRLAGIWIIATG